MEFMLYFIYYVSFAILSFVLLDVPSLRTSESDMFTTRNEDTFMIDISKTSLFLCVHVLIEISLSTNLAIKQGLLKLPILQWGDNRYSARGPTFNECWPY